MRSAAGFRVHKMSISVETDTILLHTIQGEDAEDLIEERYGWRPDFIGSGEIPGDDSSGFIEMYIEAISLSKSDVRFLQGKTIRPFEEFSALQLILQEEVYEERLPEGMYRIEFTWG
jgi:hypothetical protein